MSKCYYCNEDFTEGSKCLVIKRALIDPYLGDGAECETLKDVVERLRQLIAPIHIQSKKR